jgi:putative FmdB family regulatory protein
MPNYEYRCLACDDPIQIRRPASDSLAPVQCPACGSWRTRRVWSFSLSGPSKGSTQDERARAEDVAPLSGIAFNDCIVEGGSVAGMRVGTGVNVRTTRTTFRNNPVDVDNAGRWHSTDDQFD